MLGRKHVAVKHQPVLINFWPIILFANDRDALDIGSERFWRVAQVEAGRSALDAPVNLVDVTQEQKRARAQVAKTRCDLLCCAGVLRFQGQDDLSLVRRTRRTRYPFREDVVFNGEVLVARVNLREIGNGVDRLKTETEAANR